MRKTNPKTVGLISISFSRGISLGINWTRPCRITAITKSARAPPINASSKLSVNSCSIMRRRLAPSARRIDISLRRPLDLASIRLARLTQPISNTSPTAARTTYRIVCTLPTNCWCADRTRTDQPACEGYSFGNSV